MHLAEIQWGERDVKRRVGGWHSGIARGTVFLQQYANMPCRVAALNPFVHLCAEWSFNISRFECLKPEDAIQTCYFAQSSWTASSELGEAKCRSEVAEQVSVDSVEINRRERERESLLVLVGDRLKLDSFVAFCCGLLRAGFAMSRSGIGGASRASHDILIPELNGHDAAPSSSQKDQKVKCWSAWPWVKQEMRSALWSFL